MPRIATMPMTTRIIAAPRCLRGAAAPRWRRAAHYRAPSTVMTMSSLTASGFATSVRYASSTASRRRPSPPSIVSVDGVRQRARIVGLRLDHLPHRDAEVGLGQRRLGRACREQCATRQSERARKSFVAVHVSILLELLDGLTEGRLRRRRRFAPQAASRRPLRCRGLPSMRPSR